MGKAQDGIWVGFASATPEGGSATSHLGHLVPGLPFRGTQGSLDSPGFLWVSVKTKGSGAGLLWPLGPLSAPGLLPKVCRQGCGPGAETPPSLLGALCASSYKVLQRKGGWKC